MMGIGPETDPSGLVAPPRGLGSGSHSKYKEYKKHYDYIKDLKTGNDVLALDQFPKLTEHTGKQYLIIKVPYEGANCFAFAAGQDKPFGEDADSAEGKKLAAGDIDPLTQYYKRNGFELWKIGSKDAITNDDLAQEDGYVKIAVFGHIKSGKITSVTHAAVQTGTGTWQSKLGEKGPVIEHRVRDLENKNDPKAYGEVIAVYRIKITKGKMGPGEPPGTGVLVPHGQEI